MTRVVLVHGRSQQGKDPETLRRSWVAALAECPGQLTDEAVVSAALPFYGDLLDRWSRHRQTVAAVERGETAKGPQVDAWDVEFIRDAGAGAGLTEDEIAAEMPSGVVERGPENWETTQAIVRALDRRAPGLGRLVLGLLADVKTYLTVPQAREEVDAVVQAPIKEAIDSGDRLIVVGHSLGSVISYAVLHELAKQRPVPDVELFLTAGSPLGIRVVKRELMPPALGKPANVRRWLNAADRRDPVALYEHRGGTGFPGVTDHAAVHNPRDDPHGIVGYLRDETVWKAIRSALQD